jgi:hypothetical protein
MDWLRICTGGTMAKLEVIDMDLYRQTNREFFLATAMLRNAYGIDVMPLNDIEAGAWLKENEIQDFTIAYMSGGEL